ncbi:dihydroneopterin aldolase family protein [Methanolapillus ohkumae]|uniref:Dihydroneopterin aldolase n=1 Tax=Methanolapillus ohkumae TaxID=3028298 RepID=A0AA97A6K8_9EURY|nr:hypothetical protein MsAm2_12080 [Methanosarcinaceae archaeon Am2]
MNHSEKDKEQALFEAGIKLGSLYHQFVGTPLTLQNKKAVEDAISKSIAAQPFVESIRVQIHEKMIEEELNSVFQYTELKGKMLDVRLVVRCGKSKVFASLQWDEKLKYPLMKIDQIEEE